jgi:hypothetical protein
MMIHHISPRRIARNTGPLNQMSGRSIKCVVETGQANFQSSSKTQSLFVMMPFDGRSVNTIFSNIVWHGGDKPLTEAR